MAKRKYEIDMVNGAILPKLLRFCIPLALSGMLQLLYNAADVIVVGRFCGSTALAAVGSNGALVNLTINIFIGLSVGTGVVVAQYYGAQDGKGVHRAVHTSVLLGFLGGILVMIIGLFTSKPLLVLMDCPEDVLPLAEVYLRILFLGMPANMTYNFGSAVLRAVGDTKRPLYFLTFSGLVNVLLNLWFVVGFDMSVAGVALATIISQVISATLVVICLIRSEGIFKLNLRELRIDMKIMGQVIRIGLPAGVQGALFSISNILIQSSVNSFGSIAMAGNAAASNIEGFVYTAQNSVYQGAITFTGQNVGAKRYDRLHKITATCCLTVTVIGFVLGMVMYAFGGTLLSIYDPNPDVIAVGLQRMLVFGLSYFMCGVMEVLVGCMRGMGTSVVPMIVSLMGACVFRIIYIYTIFAQYHSLMVLYVSYPVSWVLTSGVHFICYLFVHKRLVKKAALSENRAAEA
ncbi:MAG: MATE family efflux transporter [Clostridia bacterium]|nr:MATE family efflux transporter [Clostridia bacterium]